MMFFLPNVYCQNVARFGDPTDGAFWNGLYSFYSTKMSPRWGFLEWTLFVLFYQNVAPMGLFGMDFIRFIQPKCRPDGALGTLISLFFLPKCRPDGAVMILRRCNLKAPSKRYFGDQRSVEIL